MAEQKKKSQAEKAASAKKSNKTQNTKATDKKTKEKNVQTEAAKKGSVFPVRLISAAICLGLFVLFVVIALNPQGVLISLLSSIFQGLIGTVAFYISIPVLLYLFVIHAFSKNKPIKMRTICLISFVLVCGCISHLALNPQNLPTDITMIGELYIGGEVGSTGGVICGLIALFLSWIAGPWIPYILLFWVVLSCCCPVWRLHRLQL